MHNVKVSLGKRKVKRRGRCTEYWELRWDSGKMSPSGKPVMDTESLGTCKKVTREMAEERQRQKMIDFGSGAIPLERPEEMRLSHLFQLYEKVEGHSRRHSTVYNWRKATKRCVAALDDALISKIRVDALAVVRGHLAGKGLSTGTIKKVSY